MLYYINSLKFVKKFINNQNFFAKIAILLHDEYFYNSNVKYMHYM